MIKFLIKLLIEVTIAAVLFILIIKYTPVFNDLLPSSQNTTTQQTTQSTTQVTETVKVSKYYNEQGNEISKTEYLNLFDNPADQLIQSISSYQEARATYIVPGRSCTTPRGTKIQDGTSVIAYMSSYSMGDNRCQSEQRTCKNGRLQGSYTHRTCDYTIDGVRGNNDVIIGASENKQLFIPTYTPPPAEYVQPTYATDKGKKYALNGQILTNKNRLKPSFKRNNNSMGRPYKNEGDRYEDYPSPTHSAKSCSTPRGETVSHGDFALAYNKSTNLGSRGECTIEKRACIDGKLLGSFQYKECKNIPVKDRVRY